MKTIFEYADKEVLLEAITEIANTISKPALINLDAADLYSILNDAQKVSIGMGVAKGANKATEAAKQAVLDPDVATALHSGARVLFMVSGDMTISETSDALNCIQEEIKDGVNILCSSRYDEEMADEVKIIVLAVE